MASFNQVTLLGNLGQDPDVKSVGQNGDKLANLSLATSERWKDKNTGEQKERTQWHRIVIWNDGIVGVVEKLLKKGDQIMVVGQLETRKWQDQNGNDRYATEVVLRPFKSQLQIIRCKAWDQNRDSNFGSGSSSGGTTNTQRQTTKQELDDEIPF